jgi:hypothetical protein
MDTRSEVANREASRTERMVQERCEMTIQIPDDLAHGLEGIATARSKSVEELAVESLRLLFEPSGSPHAVLKSVRGLPHPSVAAVDEMEAAIFAGRLPVRDEGTFDERRTG